MSSRKVLVASYCAEEHFIIPKGLDLDDETVVEGYGVKWGTLYIDFVDGRQMQIKAKFSVNDNDFKRPDDTEIRDVDDYGYGEEDFDDEDEDEQIEKESEEQDYDKSPPEPEPDMIDDTIVSGVVCKKCNNIVPDHYYIQHITPDNPIHNCPHVIHPICAMNMHLILLDNIKNNTLHKYKNYVEPLKNNK